VLSGYDYENGCSPLAHGKWGVLSRAVRRRSKEMKYGELTLGQIEAIVNKLGGMEGVMRFLSGETMVTAPVRAWNTWKTITLGTHMSVNALRNAMKAAGNKISDLANYILGKTPLAKTETEINLVKVTVAELGFKDGAHYRDIIVRAKELGLDYCPAEVGPQLRLQYQDQPSGEWPRIAMEPITGLCGSLGIFRVGQDDDGSWLYWDRGCPMDFWRDYDTFVFASRK